MASVERIGAVMSGRGACEGEARARAGRRPLDTARIVGASRAPRRVQEGYVI